MAERDVVVYDVSERIATITLNRPEARNALSSEVLELLPGPLHVHLLERAAREEAHLQHVLDAVEAGLLGRLADHVLERRQVLRQQRLRELGEVHVARVQVTA